MAVVIVPPLLRALTGDIDRVEVPGNSLRKVINELEARYPGVKERLVVGTRIRPEISIAVNGGIVAAGLVEPIGEHDEILIIPAISGGAAFVADAVVSTMAWGH
ncbi:MAG: molybdopterin synthase sulfur carrier subunit [Chloroflexi bacterium]|jgi:molybdopterin synthase sulfur carrier subunit|nr:MAG: molybdopterin synthase sulfur carrier subunit [Chloroflexota bacterium]